MSERKYHIYLDDYEYRHIVQSLITLKNNLTLQGRYTDAVDELLCKVTSAKPEKIKVKYI